MILARVKCHLHRHRQPQSCPEVGRRMKAHHKLRALAAAPSPKQLSLPGNEDIAQGFLVQGRPWISPPPAGDRCAHLLAAHAAGGSPPHAGVINGFTLHEIAGSSSANPSAAPCSPLFSSPGELGSHSLSSRLRKLGDGDGDRRNWGPGVQGHPGGIHPISFPGLGIWFQCLQTSQKASSHPYF